MTEADGGKGIRGVRINYRINNYSWYTSTPSYNDSGEWSIWADEGDQVTIWAQKDNYMFQPAPYRSKVTGDKRDVNFKVIGWSDNFSTKDGKWYEGKLSDIPGDYSYAEYVFEDDTAEYKMYLDNSDVEASSARSMLPFTLPSSYTVKVTAYQKAGSGRYGLLFNVNSLSPGNTYYVFRVDSYIGYYELVKMRIYPDGIKPEKMEPSGYPSIITNGPNILEVKQNYNRVELLINNEKIYGDYIPEGEVNDFIQVGLHVWADAGKTHTVHFDDFHVTATGIGPQMQMMNMMMGGTVSFKDIELE